MVTPADTVDEIVIDRGPLAGPDPSAAGAASPVVVSAPVAEVTTPAPEATASTPVAYVAAPAAPPPTAGPPLLDPQVREYITRLEQSQVEAQEQKDLQRLESHMAEQQKALEEQYGLAPAHAKEIAEKLAAAAWGQFQSMKTAQMQVNGAQAKVTVAAKLAEQYNVPVGVLLQYNTPQAMKQMAEYLVAQNATAAKIAALEAQVAKQARAAVPAGQKFDSGQGTARGETNYVDLLKSGKPLPPAAEIDRMTARYLRG